MPDEQVKSKKPDRTIHVIAGSDEQAADWTNDDPVVDVVTPPPIAQDFTDNPFQFTNPVDIGDVPVSNGTSKKDKEDEDWLSKGLKRLGIDTKQFSSVGDLTNDKIKFTDDGSQLAAALVSSVLGVMFSLAGQEYEILAPSKELAYRMIHPMARIYARHSKVVTEISPDYLDISSAIEAIGEYAIAVMDGVREIKWMKANGYVYQRPSGEPRPNSSATRPEPEQQYSNQAGQPQSEPEPVPTVERYAVNEPGRSGRGYRIDPSYQAQNGISDEVAGSYDVRGPSSTFGQGGQNDERRGSAVPQPVGNLDTNQRYQYEALSLLRQRDLNHRRRRAGLI